MSTAGATMGLAATIAPADAATPSIGLSSAAPVVTLPSGCVANDFRVSNWTDGSYHGYIQATCDKKPQLFYVQRYADGRWALRRTTIDMPIVYSSTVDSTGTYFVGKRSNHDLVLVRRNNDGTLSGVHVLWSYDKDSPVGFLNVEQVTVAAAGGNYWASWDANGYSSDFQEHDFWQARTVPPAIPPTVDIDIDHIWYAPTLVTRPGQSAQLIECELSTDENKQDPTSSTIVATPNGTTWTRTQQFPADTCTAPGGGPAPRVAAYLHGHTYFSRTNSNGIYDDRSGAFRFTPLAGSTDPAAVLPITNTRIDYVAADQQGTEFVWTQNADGSFAAAPTATLPPAPVPAHQDQIINRSGRLIRLIVQKDSHGDPGRRLLQQVQE